ncbi:sulfotransferase family protein [Roseovarius sp. A21]|uniref:Sulfotransferase family protein n=1 Tax=Roseovarius bejariae TaxID=2576383 RepID=A0A844CNU5_9RHOB|nr:sulfotransferase family 2 domain-containing protein [Roseovarius bejariae]MRU16272.1 sulfotransferase family protein [Roseovarius bejariae]
MIISPGRNYIFVHIPKTGGTSMALALEGRAMKDDILIGDTPKARRRRKRLKGVETAGRLWKHSTLADIDGLVSPDVIDRAFVFTLVRNPWNRMVSYYHWLQDQAFEHPAVSLAKAVDFSTFLNTPETQAAMRAAPYGHYVTDAKGRERCDAFIRLEHLETDGAPLWEHLGFCLDLPVNNRSTRDRDYRRYYSQDDSTLVKSLFHHDVDRFGYAY